MLDKYEKKAKEVGVTADDVKRGYMLCNIGNGVWVVQTIDDLHGTEFQRFENDTEAGEQALRDGLNVMLEMKNPSLRGIYVKQ